MRKFSYSGIRWEDCEGTPFSSLLGEASVSAYKLISVGFCALLDWITWWLCPILRATSPVEVLGVSDMVYVPYIDAGSSVIPLGAAWGSYPVGRYWVPGFSDYYCQAYLGRVMLEDLLRCHSFVRVNFSCIVSSEYSSTRFFQFPGTVIFLVCSIVEYVS